MEFDFDKEIDSLLRQAAKGGKAFAAKNLNAEHIDADEVSMFAENVLSEKAKPFVINHLANCDRCRTILSNTIALNAEAETENQAASIAVRKTKAETTNASNEIPWYQRYQKLFSSRNLAYGTGALALIFAVGIGFFIVQNAADSDTEITQANTDASIAKPTPSLSKSAEQEDLANSNSAAAVDATNSDVSVGTRDSSVNAETSKGNLSESVKNKGKIGKVETLSRDKPKTSEKTDLEAEAVNQPETAEVNEAATADDNKIETAQRKSDVQSETRASRPTAPPPAAASRRSERMPQASSAKKRESAENRDASSFSLTETRQINGKTFTLKNGIWYDSAYKNQSITNVRRGTSQYKNLDSGLRSITDKLNGTVVVVWKSKAYRIQ